MDVKITLLAGGIIPTYANTGDAGADLYANLSTFPDKEYALWPGYRTLIPTGIKMEIPEGYVALVHPRSGLAINHGITVLNSPGTIDSGYRGEICVNLINLNSYGPAYVIKHGDRIAQVVFQKVETARFKLGFLSESIRGENGHGSTG